MEYETPFLDKLINNEIKIEEKLFLLKKTGKDYLVEPHYINLRNSILYQEITKKNKFEKDDINESDKSITYNCSKARGLSLEYYLNCIFMEIFTQTNCLERYIILTLFY